MLLLLLLLEWRTLRRAAARGGCTGVSAVANAGACFEALLLRHIEGSHESEIFLLAWCHFIFLVDVRLGSEALHVRSKVADRM